MQSAEDLAIAITGIDPDAYFPGCAKQIQVREILATYAAMIAARDAEWQARVDAFLEDNNRSEEQVKKQFATAVSFKARAEKAEAQVEKLDAEVRRLRAVLEPTPDARELAEEIQNIKWLIDEGPAHEKLTEAQVRLSAVKEKIVARNNILTNDSYNLTTVLYNHMTRGPWKHIPPEFYEIEERKAEVAPLIAAHDARLLDEAAERLKVEWRKLYAAQENNMPDHVELFLCMAVRGEV